MMSEIHSKKYFLISIILTFLVSAVFVSAQIYVPNTTNIDKILIDQERQKMREALIPKINQIQDLQKKYLANKITTELDSLNGLWVGHFNNVLSKLEEIVQKVESRSEKAAYNGKDVSAVKVSIEKAQNSINLAKSVVDEQSKKIYIVNAKIITPSISSDQDRLVATLRGAFVSIKNQLQDDVFSVRDGVMQDARDDVREAFLTLADIPNVDDRPTGF